MTHVARKEFAIDLAVNNDINAIEEEKKKLTMVAIKQNLADAKVEKSQTQGTSSNEETSNGMEIIRQSNTRKRKKIDKKGAQSSHKRIKVTSSNSTSKAKFNLKIKKASNSEDLEDEEEALEETDEETVACEKRSHHLTVKCRIPGCGLKVKDIKRHLKTHVTKKQLDETDVPRATATIFTRV